MVTLTLCDCTSRTYQDDKSDPSYQSGKTFPLNQNVPAASGSPAAQEPLIPGTEGTNAAIGLIATGIALAANRDYYKSVAITGKVICRSSPHDPIQFPCNNVEVMLIDSAGKTLTQVEPNAGEFAFRVPEKKPFHLKISSTHYRMKPDTTKPLMRGDDIILNLFPIHH